MTVSSLLGMKATVPSAASIFHASDGKPRARDLGVPFDGTPGPGNAITDVAGIAVGHTTLIAGDGALKVGVGPVRTGVTALLPRGLDSTDPTFAGWFSLNGNGEMTGTTWIEESGLLEGPVLLTNSSSVGVARDAVVKFYATKPASATLAVAGRRNVRWLSQRHARLHVKRSTSSPRQVGPRRPR